jgi:hypothetical protein
MSTAVEGQVRPDGASCLAPPVRGVSVSSAVIVWQSGKTVLTRLLDGVDPEVIDTITHAAGHTPGVQQVTEVRARPRGRSRWVCWLPPAPSSTLSPSMPCWDSCSSDLPWR